MKWVCKMKKKNRMSNHIDTLIIRKDFKEDKRINIKIIKEEDGIIINIHGIWHHKTIIQQDIIIDLLGPHIVPFLPILFAIVIPFTTCI
jgi:hypothetical protein